MQVVKLVKEKSYFGNRVIDVWNNLPQEAKSAKDFKIAIGNHSEYHEIQP